MRCTDGERPATGGLEAIFSVSFGQIQQPQARPVALLGVGPVLELPTSCVCDAHLACARGASYACL
jgi:hypothetical protein